MRAWRLTPGALVCVLALACAGPGAGPAALDVPRGDTPLGSDTIQWGHGGDARADAAGLVDAPDEPAPDLPPDPPDAPGDTDPPDLAPCVGASGCPCATDDACTLGVCAESRQGRTCAAACEGGACPGDLTCVPIVGAFGPRDVCLDPFARLCRPCRADGDCVVPRVSSAEPARCLPRSAEEGAFCASACDAGTLCPPGYTCRLTDLGGAQVPVCRPVDNGACPCLPAFVDAGWATDCARTNGLGTCVGARTCDVTCSAPEPAPEACNGVDDDCDGDTDPSDSQGCTAYHADRDQDGAGAPSDTRCLCAPLAPYTAAIGDDCDDGNSQRGPTAPEVCNGVDDDCDAATDEDLPDCR